VRLGGGWNWLRVMANGGDISSIEPSGTVTRELISKMDHREIYCEDGTGSGSCLMVVVLAVLNLLLLLQRVN